MEKLLAIVCCLLVTGNAYKLYNFESFCGKSLTLGKEDTPGVVVLDYKTIEKSSNCALTLSTNDEDLIISIALKGVHFRDCKSSELEIKGFDSLDNSASPELGSEVVFSTLPHFCGKEIISPQPISVNQGYYNPRVSFAYKQNNETAPAYFEFYYSVHSAMDDNPIWPVVTTTAAPTSTTRQEDTTVTASTSSVDVTTTDSPVSSTQMPKTTTKMADETTVKVADKTTTKAADETTTDLVDETTTMMPKETTVKVADETTTHMADKTTTKMADETTIELVDETTTMMPKETTIQIADETTTQMTDTTTTKMAEDTTTMMVDETTTIMAVETTTKMADETTTNMAKEPSTKMADTTTPKMVDETTTRMVDETTTNMAETTTKMAEETTTMMADETTTNMTKEPSTKMADTTTPKMVDETTTRMVDETTTKMAETTTKTAEETTTMMVDETTTEQSVTTTQSDKTTKEKLKIVTDIDNTLPTETIPVTKTTKTLPDTTATTERLIKSTTAKLVESTTANMVESTTGQAESTTVKVETSTTERPTETTTTEQTTSVEVTTEKATTKPSTIVRTRPTPQEVTTRSSHTTQSRTCKCEIWVKGFGVVGEEKKIDVSYIMSQFVRGSISDSNCHDQYRCNQICDKYMSDYMANGLDTKRRKFGEETVGDYVCTSLGQLVLDNKPASVALVATARGCSGHSFVTTLSYNFCCVGSTFAFKSESCSKAPASLADPPTTTSPTTRARPVAADSKTRRCQCDILIQVSGDKDKKIDVGDVNYKYSRESIADSDCTDQYRCSSICRSHVDEHLSDDLDTLRNKYSKETAGDYVCNKIGHEVLSNKAARVTLVTTAKGCEGHSHVTFLNFRLCCIGRPYSWKAIECHRAALHRDDIFG